MPPAVALVEPAQRLERPAHADPVAGLEHPERAGELAGAGEQHRARARVMSVDLGDARRDLDREARAGRVVDQGCGRVDERALLDQRRQRRVDEPVEGALHHRVPEEEAARDGEDEREPSRVAGRERDQEQRGRGDERRDGGIGTVRLARKDADDERRHRGERAGGPHTETRSLMSAYRASPIPRTSWSSPTLRKPLRRSRSATIASARVGPIPGSSSSSVDVAVLMLIRGGGPPLGSAGLATTPLLVPTSGAAGAPTIATAIRWPSATLAARFSRSRSAFGSPPPAASTASITRSPDPTRTTPGRATAPATWTMSRPPASV